MQLADGWVGGQVGETISVCTGVLVLCTDIYIYLGLIKISIIMHINKTYCHTHVLTSINMQ